MIDGITVKKGLHAAFPVLGWALISAAGTSAQTSEVHSEVVDVLVVEVSVRVLRDGKPVRDFTRDDLELFDRGKVQAITGFQVIDVLESASEKDSASDS